MEMSPSSRQIYLRQGSWGSRRRRKPLLKTQVADFKDRLAEVAGGTTAECAAVCCCCPCGLVNLLVLAVYKAPAELCRRVMRKKRRKRLIKKGLLRPNHLHCTCGCDGKEMMYHPVGGFDTLSTEFRKSMTGEVSDDESSDEDVMQLEKEMWDRFYGTGFWRSPSQRESSSNTTTTTTPSKSSSSSDVNVMPSSAPSKIFPNVDSKLRNQATLACSQATLACSQATYDN